MKPPESYLHGADGPVVIVPARIAAWLEYYAGLNRLRVERRGQDPEADTILNALRIAALQWRSTATGTVRAARAELPPSSEWLSTREAADMLHMTERGVRKAIQRGDLNATSTAGRWRIRREDIAHYRATRAA